MHDDRLIELLRGYDEPVAPGAAFRERLLASLRVEAGFAHGPRGGHWRLRLRRPFDAGLPLPAGRVGLLLGILAILLIAALALVIVGALRQAVQPPPGWRLTSIVMLDSAIAPADWSIGTLRSSGDVGQDPAFAIGPDGVPVVAFDDSSAGRIMVARCVDTTCSAIGPTIDGGPVGLASAGTDSYIAVGPTGEVWVARMVDRSQPSSAVRDLRIEVRRLCPTATETCRAAGPVDLGPGQNPVVRIRLDGRLVVLFGSLDGDDSNGRLVICGDEACTSGNVVTNVPVSSIDRSMVIGADNRPVIATTQAGEMGVLSCLDDTCARSKWAVVGTARRPRIALAPDGRPILAALADRSMVLYRCSDVTCSGGSRSTLTDLGPSAAGGDELALLDLDVAADGRAFVSLAAGSELRLVGCLAPACDRAARIVLDDTSPDGAAPHALGVDTSGRPFVLYARRSDLVVAQCMQSGCVTPTFGSASTSPTPSGQPSALSLPVRTLVDPNGGFNPAITVGTDGRAVAVYSRPEAVIVLHCGNATCDQGNQFATISSPDAYAAAIAIGRDGWPVLAYIDSHDRLSVVRCHDAGCSTGSSIEHPKIDADFMSIAVAVPADDRPLVAYLDSQSAEIRLARCADAPCRAITSARVDPNREPSTPNSIELGIGPDDSPILGYAFASGVARIARCPDLDCSQPGVLTAGTAGIGQDTAALGIGPDGVPVLAFYSDGSLRVARCSDRTCKSVSSVRVDQATAKWWSPVGVGFGADGNPVIAYYSPTNLDTKVARCHDPACKSADLFALDGSDANGADDHTGIAFLPGGVPIFVYSREPSVYAEACTDPRCGG